ncbi:hypothetical protein [Peredibacter starrii]|uniref:Uncharacterized protein n=1 Tax=Peredibacter starrii TaxID=28202 RepID=A0AAX4HV95_9BACT|nr:hypothetical protein [Peredibacter starrii]WPU67166.1 hypothetical protein SOO65_10410 [Peredibacter starrii]
MKHTRSVSIFITLLFLMGQLSMHNAYARSPKTNEVNTEVEIQPLIEFKYSLAKLVELVEDQKPVVVSTDVTYPTSEFHLLSTLLNSHHICLPPPVSAA